MNQGPTFTRRSLLAVSALTLSPTLVTAQSINAPRFSAPMGLPGLVKGDGCYIRHGYACENIDFQPNWWHTGENWYLVEGDSAGAEVYAVADGVVRFVGSDYPGRVIIIEHAADLYSMYGHLEYQVETEPDALVKRGDRIGTVLNRSDGRSPSHLHFEIRNFYQNPEVNGGSPRYDYPCGIDCPPGPGYWPMSDPDHPSQMGWRNPLHVLNSRAFTEFSDTWLVAAQHLPVEQVPLFDQPNGLESGSLYLKSGDRFPLLGIETGEEASLDTSAEAYSVWYQLQIPNSDKVWVSSTRPDSSWKQSDGRAAGLRFIFLPIS